MRQAVIYACRLQRAGERRLLDPPQIKLLRDYAQAEFVRIVEEYVETTKLAAHFDTIPLTKSFEQWSRGECVLITSRSRFKGPEADAIVIVETSSNEDAQDNANSYVAYSRAKHLLT